MLMRTTLAVWRQTRWISAPLLIGSQLCLPVLAADPPSHGAGTKTSAKKGATSTEKTAASAPVPEKANIRLNFLSSSWEKVFKEVAAEAGLQLVVHALPEGRFSRRDFKKHTLDEAVQILNRELEPKGFKVLANDGFLTVVSMRQARTDYRRPLYPEENQPVAGTTPTVDQVEVRRPERQFDSITDRVRQKQASDTGERVSTRPRSMQQTASPSRPIVQTNYEQPAETDSFADDPPTVPRPAGPPVSVVANVKQRTARDVARQVRSAFTNRNRLLPAGPKGFPAYEVLEINPGGKASETVWFTVELDMARNQIWFHGPEAVVNSLVDLATSLDVPDEGTGTTRLVAGEPGLTGVADKLQPVLARMVSARRQVPGDAADAPGEPPQPPQPATPAAPADAPAAVAIEAPANDDLMSLIESMKGDVNIEAMDDLDLIILRGNERDIESVMTVIRAIERMALGATPEIRLHHLKHVDSESLAVLLTDVYERMGNLRNRPTGQQSSPRSVNVVAVGKPNAILILAPGSMVESVVELVEELDQPVDPRSEVQVFALKHAVAADVVTMLDQFYQNRTALESQIVAVADARSNSIIVQARPLELTEVAQLIRKIDKDEAAAVAQVKVIPLKNAVAEELAEFLTTAIQSVLNPAQTQGLGGQGFGGAAGGQTQQRTPKSMVLEFLNSGQRAERLVRSGLLSDIRINADVRTNSLMVTASAQSLPLIEELIRVLDQPSATIAEIKVFTLRNADATAAVELLEGLFSNDDANQSQLGVALVGAENANSSLVPLRFSTDIRTNSVVAIGGGASLQIVEAILLRLDESDLRNRQNVVIKLRNSPAADVATAVNQFLQGQRDLLQIDPNRISTSELLEQEVIVTAETVSNSLLISATPRYFEDIRRLIAELDREPAQVIIQALLVEVQLDNNDEFGVELGFQDSVFFDRSIVPADGLVTISETTTAPNGVQTTTQRIISQSGNPGFLFNSGQGLGNNISANPSKVGTQGLSNFAVGRVNNDLGYGGLVLSAGSESVSVLIRALAARRNVQILSRPQILALDNQTAEIQVGQQVPIVDGVNISAQGLANPNVVQDQAGIILNVTPRISPEGMVVMELLAEKSAFNGDGVPIFTDGTNGNVITSPIKDLSAARTTVKVPDGQTIVVGGMITKTDETIERKVPWLGDIPIIGLAFRYDSFSTRRTELLIFLTPRIIEGNEKAEFVKQVEAERMHFYLKDAEDIHGPLFGVSPEEVPYELQPTPLDQLPLKGPMLDGTMPPTPADDLMIDEAAVPTTQMPGLDETYYDLRRGVQPAYAEVEQMTSPTRSQK